MGPTRTPADCSASACPEGTDLSVHCRGSRQNRPQPQRPVSHDAGLHETIRAARRATRAHRVNPLGVGRHTGLCGPRIAARILDALVAIEFAQSAPSSSFVDLGVGVGVIAIEMRRRYWTLHVVGGPRSGYRESSPTTWSRSPLRLLKASPRIPRPALPFASRADQPSIPFQVEVTNHAPRPRGAERPVTRYFLLDAHVEWRAHQVARSSRRAAGIKCLTRA